MQWASSVFCHKTLRIFGRIETLEDLRWHSFSGLLHTYLIMCCVQGIRSSLGKFMWFPKFNGLLHMRLITLDTFGISGTSGNFSDSLNPMGFFHLRSQDALGLGNLRNLGGILSFHSFNGHLQIDLKFCCVLEIRKSSGKPCLDSPKSVSLYGCASWLFTCLEFQGFWGTFRSPNAVGFLHIQPQGALSFKKICNSWGNVRFHSCNVFLHNIKTCCVLGAWDHLGNSLGPTGALLRPMHGMTLHILGFRESKCLGLLPSSTTRQFESWVDLQHLGNQDSTVSVGFCRSAWTRISFGQVVGVLNCIGHLQMHLMTLSLFWRFGLFGGDVLDSLNAMGLIYFPSQGALRLGKFRDIGDI